MAKYHREYHIGLGGNLSKGISLGVVVIGLVVGLSLGAVWNEARKEIVFLCPNFTPGTTEQSVLTQLNTGIFLRYEKEKRAHSNTIHVDSAYNFGLYQCVIQLDQNQIVIVANSD